MNYLEAMLNQAPVAEVETLTAEIQVYKQQAGACIVEIGKRLIRAKELLPHGAWAAWLEEKVEFSERTAQRFMKVAENFSNPTPVSDLGLSKALLVLQVPEEERGEFLETPHEVNGEEKTVSEMSKRELEKVIRERDEALKQAEAAQADAVNWKNAADGAEILLENTKKKLEAAKSKEKDMSAEMERYSSDLQAAEKLKAEAEKQRSELETRLKELEEAAKAEPIQAEVVPDEETVERIRAEAIAEQKAALEQARTREQELTERLRAASNPAAVRVNLWFGDLQEKTEKLKEAFSELRKSQPETAEKFKGPIAGYFSELARAIGGDV